MNLNSAGNKVIPLLILISLLVSSCTPAQTAPGNNTITRVPTTVYRIPSYITEYTLVGLTHKSDLIVRGRITGSEGIVNMARDVNDYSKPDPKLFGIGQIYGFAVTQRIKASGSELSGEEIKIIQVEGLIYSPSTNPPSQEAIEAAKTPVRGSPLIKNQEYILFLKLTREFDDLKGYYTGTAHPWQFIIEKGCAYPETPWEMVVNFYQPQETEKFVADVKASMNVKETPQPKWSYPVPGSAKSPCPPRGKAEAPYP